MATNVASIRRNLKNLAHNYTDAQVKVREATSNDHWGPSSTLMSEIADLTYNVLAFSEIMQMIWKRLNDHGKNWRHVYKALVLLEYLIKTGSEKVAQQCKENIFAIKTLRDFQYTEENKDQGMNVREKAKQLVSLLQDDDKLKNERIRALKAKERFAQSSVNFMSSDLASPSSPEAQMQSPHMSDGARSPQSDLESARPQTAGEEELQLQLAIAMSKEEADQEEQKKKSDELRLQMAIMQSKDEMGTNGTPTEKPSALLDLLDLNLTNPSGSLNQNGLPNDPWSMSMPHSVSHPVGQNVSPNHTVDPWGLPISDKLPQSNNTVWSTPAETSRSAVSSPVCDPWSPVGEISSSQPSVLNDPWNAPLAPTAAPIDPWGSPVATQQTPQDDLDEFAILRSRRDSSDTRSPNHQIENFQNAKKTPESFLGDNLSLVNLDNLIGSSSTKPAIAPNPFAAPTTMFQQPPKPSMNEMRGGNPSPWAPQQPSSHNNTFETNLNPFLS